MPVLPTTDPRVVGPSSRCSQRPRAAGDAMACTRTERRPASCQHCSRMATIACGVSRSSEERPDPSAIVTPAVGTPFCASTPATTVAPAAVVPPVARHRAELLQEQLGREVVAVRVDGVEDLLERAGKRDGQHLAAGPERARLPRDGDAGLDQQRAEFVGGRVRRGRRVALPRPGAVDDEGRERRRLLDVERGLPARSRPHSCRRRTRPRRLIPVTRLMPAAGSCARAAESATSERRVAVALEDEVAGPRPVGAERALPAHLGREAELRAEHLQGRVRDRQLLVRRGHEPGGRVVRVDDLARDEVDRDGAGPRRADPLRVERPRRGDAARWSCGAPGPAAAWEAPQASEAVTNARIRRRISGG